MPIHSIGECTRALLRSGISLKLVYSVCDFNLNQDTQACGWSSDWSFNSKVCLGRLAEGPGLCRYILWEAEEQGLLLPYACRMGCCTACAVRIKEGEMYQPQVLLAETCAHPRLCWSMQS